MSIQVIDVRHHGGDAAFLIDDGTTSILYDVGFGFTGYAIADNVKAILGERPLDYIFLTHSHYDHALGCPYVLRRYPTATVVGGVHTAEVFARDGAKRTMKRLDGEFAAVCGVTDYEFLGDELKVDVVVRDGDTVQAGDMTFEVIALPGHTRCCIGFYCKDKQLLLANETLGVYDGNHTIMSLCLVSYADMIASIKRVEALDVTTVVAPHGGLLDPAQTAYYLGNMRAAAEKNAAVIVEQLKRGLTDDEIVAHFKDEYWHGYIREIYPEGAIALNTSLMVQLFRKELL